MNLILHPLSSQIQKLSHIKLSYLPLETKLVFNLLYDESFKFAYITDTIPNSFTGIQFPTQDKLNVCIIAINGKEPIIDQGELD